MTKFFLNFRCIFFITFCIWGELSFAKGLDLQDLIQYALTHSPSYQSETLNVEASTLKKQNAVSLFLPELNLSTTQGLLDTTPSSNNDSWNNSLNLTLSETLYNNGQNILNYQDKNITLTKAHIELEKAKAQLHLDVITAYFQYILSKNKLAVQKKEYQLLQQQYQLIESQYTQGVKARIDYLRFKTKLRRSEISVNSFENTVKKSLNDLKRIINWDTKDLVINPYPFKKITEKLSAYTVDMEKHFDKKIYDLDKQVGQIAVKQEENEWGPKISLEGQGSYANSDYLKSFDTYGDDDYRTVSWSVYLKLEWNLWDFQRRSRNISLKRLAKKQIDLFVEGKLLDLENTLTKLYMDSQQVEQNLKLAHELVNLEKNNFEKIEQDYRNGKTTFLDLINSLTDYSLAEENYYQNYIDYKLILAKLFYHQGTIHENIQLF